MGALGSVKDHPGFSDGTQPQRDLLIMQHHTGSAEEWVQVPFDLIFRISTVHNKYAAVCNVACMYLHNAFSEPV